MKIYELSYKINNKICATSIKAIDEEHAIIELRNIYETSDKKPKNITLKRSDD